MLGEILLWASGVMFGGCATAIPLARKIKALTRSTVCKHLTWTPWEPCELAETWGPRYNRITELHKGQKRHCLECNFLQTELVVAERK